MGELIKSALATLLIAACVPILVLAIASFAGNNFSLGCVLGGISVACIGISLILSK